MPRVLTETDVADFRERLCAAAERLFAEHGPDAVTMRQLAAELGVSPMTPYRYFEDKDEILAAVRANGFNRFAEALELARAKATSAKAKGAAVGEAYITFAFEHPHTYKLMFDLNQPDEGRYPLLVEAGKRAHATMSGYVKDQTADGLVAGDPEEIGRMLWASTHGAIVLEMAGKFPPGTARRLSQEIATALAKGLKPGGRVAFPPLVRFAVALPPGQYERSVLMDGRDKPGHDDLELGFGMSAVKPFEVAWSEADVEAVLGRVWGYPWPPQPAVPDGWAYGCDGAYLRDLCTHWTELYDWRAAMADLNRFPQFTARVEDYDLHFLHVVGEAGGKRPLIITHGWPGSHYEFWQAIEKLAFPSRFGGEASDAFDLVIPSLPGFGFSSKPTRPIGQRTTARLFNTLMTQVLGYKTYLAQGGDWGAMVTSWLGRDHGASAKAIHLNMLGFRPHGGPTGEAEIAWATRQAGAMDMMGAYFRLQVSKPQSLAWMGAGNPVGQAAWIAERFHDWSDLSAKSMDEAYPKDRLLTNIMLYVMTDSFATGAWYYRGLVEEGGVAFQPGERVETPTSFANFPGEPLYSAPPRSFAERAYNIVRWTDMPRGGHFAAMEEPDLFVDEVRAWGREAS